MDCSTLTGLHCWWKHLCLCTHTVAAHWQSGKVLLFPPAVNDTRRALLQMTGGCSLHTCSSHRLMRSDCGIGSGSSAVADNAAGNKHFAALSRFQFPPTHPPRAPGATGWTEAEQLSKACSRFAIFCCSGTPYPLKSLCSVLVLLKEDDFALLCLPIFQPEVM